MIVGEGSVIITFSKQNLLSVQASFFGDRLCVQPESLSELFSLFAGQPVHPDILKQLTGGRKLFWAYGYDRVDGFVEWREVRKLIPEGTVWESFDSGNGECAIEFEDILVWRAGLERYPQRLEELVRKLI